MPTVVQHNLLGKHETSGSQISSVYCTEAIICHIPRLGWARQAGDIADPLLLMRGRQLHLTSPSRCRETFSLAWSLSGVRRRDQFILDLESSCTVGLHWYATLVDLVSMLVTVAPKHGI